MGIVIITDIINIVMSTFLVFICVKMVLRTEKELDTAAKLFTIASVILLSATFVEMYAYLGSSGTQVAFVSCQIMFSLAIIFFAAGASVLYGIVHEGSNKKQ